MPHHIAIPVMAKLPSNIALKDQTRSQFLSASTTNYEKLSVGAIISRHKLSGVGTEILLLKRHSKEPNFPNYWELPSGDIRKGETLEQALKTEVLQETNLEVAEVLEKDGGAFESHVLKEVEMDEMDDETTPAPAFMWVQKCLQVNFFVDMSPDQPKCQLVRHEGFGWFSERDLGTYEMSDEMRICLKAAFAKLSRRIHRRGIWGYGEEDQKVRRAPML